MAETKRLKVFLCHAHSDAAAVRDLFKYLRRQGVDVWLDKESLLPGEDWELEIRKAVRASDVVVVCLSKQFNQAGFRQKEVRLALDTAMEKPEGEIFIIPARLEECDTLESLRKWHWVDLFEESGRRKLIYALRARARQIGASLRRRRGDKSTKVPPKSDEVEEPAVGKPQLPVTPEQPDMREKETKDGYARLPKKDRQSGIWLDGEEYVWRDSEKLGRLARPGACRILAYLIEHKGSVCKYAEIVGAVFPQVNWRRESLRLRLSLKVYVAEIRELVEIDSEHPTFIVEMDGVGYVLKDGRD